MPGVTRRKILDEIEKKYAGLEDPGIRDFLIAGERFYPPDAVSFTMAEQRAFYDRYCAHFRKPRPTGVSAEDVRYGGVPCRHYRPKGAVNAPLMVYLHGGGFVLGGLDSHDDVCAEICGRTGFPVMSVDYRLSPEHVHPADFNDAMAGFAAALASSGLPVLLAGDSAGGNLAAAVSHATRGQARTPAGQVLIYPGLGGDQTKGSYVTHACAPMLTKRDLDFYKHIRTGGKEAGRDPTLAPLQDADFSGLPPTVIVSAECDPLSDDGGTYRDAILAAGGKAVWFNEKGLVHGYLRARHTVARARQSFTRIVEAIAALGRGEWPYA